MKKPTIIRQYSYDFMKTFAPVKLYPDLDGVLEPLPSLTVPDQQLSMSDLITRYRRGLAVNGVSVANIEQDFSIVDRLDRFQRIDMSRQLVARKRELEGLLYQAQIDRAKSRARADADAKLEAEVTKRLANVKRVNPDA